MERQRRASGVGILVTMPGCAGLVRAALNGTYEERKCHQSSLLVLLWLVVVDQHVLGDEVVVSQDGGFGETGRS